MIISLSLYFVIIDLKHNAQGSNMTENETHLMAIDMLCCHLGLSKEEAQKQLGIQSQTDLQTQIMETQEALMGLKR